MSVHLSALAAAVALTGCAALEAQIAAAAEPQARWERHDAASAQTVDHRAWAALLARYRVVGADGVARMRYAAVTAADRAALQQYVARLEAVNIDAYPAISTKPWTFPEKAVRLLDLVIFPSDRGTMHIDENTAQLAACDLIFATAFEIRQVELQDAIFDSARNSAIASLLHYP